MTDTALIDNIKHCNAMIYLVNSISEESKLSYCKVVAIPQLKAMGIKCTSDSIQDVLGAMHVYINKHKSASKPSFRKSGDDTEEMDVSITTYKWEKLNKRYEYYKDSDVVGTIEVLDKTHENRYKWTTDKGTGSEKYLYKAQKIVEHTV